MSKGRGRKRVAQSGISPPGLLLFVKHGLDPGLSNPPPRIKPPRERGTVLCVRRLNRR